MSKNEDYDSTSESYDDVQDFSGRIEPMFYIHNAIIHAQRTIALSAQSDFKQGVSAYRVLIEQIESLCRAAGYIKVKEGEQKSQYDKDITAYEESIKSDEMYVKMAKVSNKKLELLLSSIFGKKQSNEPINL